MARYFFDTDDGEERVIDQVGIEFPTLDAARSQAVAALPGIAGDSPRLEDGREIVTVVRDETGRAIFRARLAVSGEWIGGED